MNSEGVFSGRLLMKQIVGMKMKLLFEALAVEGGIALKVCLIVLKRSSQIRLVK